MKAQKKGGLGGRKPLRDLSNSSKPSPTQASKKQNSKNFAFSGEVVTSSKVPQDASNKKNSLKALFKVQTGSRKPLSDISNSGKPNLQEASKKNQNMKLGVVEEENLCPSGGIVEEQFLHNHQECIKARNRTMGMDQFLTTVGLDNGRASLHFPIAFICEILLDISHTYLFILISLLVSSRQFASPWATPVSSKFEVSLIFLSFLRILSGLGYEFDN